jgi:glucosyl-dolichyl phosphate glucuronosyltransferase
MEHADLIKFSVLIPTLNHSKKLAKCLKCLSEVLKGNQEVEVIVIDNGSNDETSRIVPKYKAKLNVLSYHYCDEPGLMAARHMGAEKSKGDILCFLDDDSLVDRKWMQGISDAFREEDVALVGGPCIPKYEVDPPDWVEYFWQQTEFGRVNTFLSLVDFGTKKIEMSPSYVYGCNYSIRKDVFFEFGGTNPDYLPEPFKFYQGDGESGLNSKLGRSKFKTVYHPKAKIHHLIPASRLTVEYFCRRRYFNGIHSSYTQIRWQNGVDAKPSTPGILKRVCRRLRKAINLKHISNKKYPEAVPKEVLVIKETIEKSYTAGFRAHQDAVRTDPKLLEWILRENYMGTNSKLPE